jgi:hypothetical protein
MSESAPAIETKTESKTATLVRRIVCWVVFGLLLFTCVMAAIRKFGG